MSYMPVRGGTRGGKDQFQWEDVKADKHRENYLGHSLMAPVGRWQKGKDLTWYSKKSKVLGQKEALRAEIAAVKRAEEEAMAAALGLKPKTVVTGNVSKQELADVCRRQSVEEKEEEGQEERMAGIGFMRWSHRHSNQGSATGAAMFESRPLHEGERQQPVPTSLPPTPTAPSASQAGQPEARPVERPVSEMPAPHHQSTRGKDKRKKRKKEKSKKKHKRSHNRKPHSSPSDSEEVSTRRGRKRAESDSGHDSEEERERKRRQRKKRRVPSSDSEEEHHDRRQRRAGKSEGNPEDEERKRRRERSNRERHRHDTSSSN